MKDNNAVAEKSKSFALRIIGLYKYLNQEKGECVMSKQILRSGTSIGANICEALRGYSKADFYNKLTISLKEASETEYWLELLHGSQYIDDVSFNSMNDDCQEIIRLLVAITKTQKTNEQQN